MTKHFALFLILFIICNELYAQINQPALGWVFDDSSVSRIDINIDQDSLDELLLEENWFNSHEYPADFYFTRDGVVDTVENVGFRLRGNTSREAYKKSFKIAINSFVSGTKYKGLKKINLNGEHNDPSIARSKLNWDLLRENKLPSTRVAHSEFYINNEYKGLYINVEHINDDFLKLRYGNKNGNLYKCLWPANLNYISTNSEDYKFESNGRRTYDLKNNLDLDDYSDLSNFIDVLNNTANDDLYCELSKVFDVEDFLEILAIDVLTGNWDGYSFNKNNYYLYHNTETDRIQYIPYDLDNTLGIDWFNEDWTQKNIYEWSNSWDYLPLYERIMDNSEMKGIFTFYVNDIIDQISASDYPDVIDDLRDLIAPFAATDTFRILDYGFTYDEFWDCYDEDIPYDHVDAGIKPFYEDRATSASNQVISQNIAPVIRYIKMYPQKTQVPISISAFVEDEVEVTNVWAYYSYQSEEDSTQLFDDGLHGDGEALDSWFANTIGSFEEVDVISLHIKASDNQDQTRQLPCEDYQYILEEGSPLVINEFMAKNDSTIQDNVGNYSDWVEIYNNSATSMSLQNYYLSDDLSNNSKWAFPDVEIESYGFYLIWCSGDTTLGENHSSFKLSANGEDVAFFKADLGDTLLVDGLSYGEQMADTSYGRQSDAHPYWVLFEYPTPNSSNGVIPNGVEEIYQNEITLDLYPNPFIEELSIINPYDEDVKVEVYSVQGRLLNNFIIKAHETQFYQDNHARGIRVFKYFMRDSIGVERVMKL